MADEIYEEPEDPIVAPAVLAARAIEPARRSDPAKLQSALRALKFALDHPATLHVQAAPTKRGGDVPVAARATRRRCRSACRARSTGRNPSRRTIRSGPPRATCGGTRGSSRRRRLREIESALDVPNRDVRAPPGAYDSAEDDGGARRVALARRGVLWQPLRRADGGVTTAFRTMFATRHAARKNGFSWDIEASYVASGIQ